MSPACQFCRLACLLAQMYSDVMPILLSACAQVTHNDSYYSTRIAKEALTSNFALFFFTKTLTISVLLYPLPCLT